MRFERRAQRVGAVGAGIAPELRLQAENPAVPVGRERGLDHRIAGVIAALQMLQPILGPFDRAAEPARREGGDRLLGVEQHLHPEPAADIGHPDPDPGLRQAQELGDAVPQHMRHLGGRADLGHVVAAVMNRDTAAAFDRRRRDPGMAEPARHHDRRRGEGIGVGIADEAAFEQGVAGDRLVDQRGAVRERRGDIGNRVFGLVGDIDQRGGVFRRVGIARDDSGDDLAGEADLGVGDQRPGGGAVAVPVGLVHAGGDRRGRAGEVAAEEDFDHAVRGARRAAVDAGNPCPRERTPQEIDMQASGRVEIVEEAPAAENQRPAVVGVIARAQPPPPTNIPPDRDDSSGAMPKGVS